MVSHSQYVKFYLIDKDGAKCYNKGYFWGIVPFGDKGLPFIGGTKN